MKNGLLGSFRFDGNGDMTPAQLMIVRITGRTPSDAGLYPESRAPSSIAC